MADDWIKMRNDLHDDPAVISITAATDCVDEDHVVGKLKRLWSWANRQTTDGNAPGITAAWIDRYVGVTGFAEAVADAGWLEITQTGIQIPNFDRHMSQSAKARALTAARVAAHRDRNAASVTKSLPEKRREEKRREDQRRKSKVDVDVDRDGADHKNISDEDRRRGIAVAKAISKKVRPENAADTNLFVKVGILVAQNRLPENWPMDAAEAVASVKERPKRPVAYFQTCLANKCDEHDHPPLNAMLASVKLPKPKGRSP
jgi:hypothetical protein